jgi:hypothetical protein
VKRRWTEFFWNNEYNLYLKGFEIQPTVLRKWLTISVFKKIKNKLNFGYLFNWLQMVSKSQAAFWNDWMIMNYTFVTNLMGLRKKNENPIIDAWKG